MNWKYKGYEIAVRSGGEFHATVAGEEFEGESLAAIKKQIDQARRRSSKPRIELPICGILNNHDRWGRGREEPQRVATANLIGINRTSREPIMDVTPDGWEWTLALPDSEGSIDFLRQYLAAKEAWEAVQAKAEELDLKVGGYGRIEVAQYDAAIETLRERYEKTKAKIPAPAAVIADCDPEGKETTKEKNR